MNWKVIAASNPLDNRSAFGPGQYLHSWGHCAPLFLPLERSLPGGAAIPLEGQ